MTETCCVRAAIFTFTLVVGIFGARSAIADTILQTVNGFQLWITDPVPVGNGSERLVSVDLIVENTSAPSVDTAPAGFIGQITGGLHHEQFLASFPFPGVVTTPTAAHAANSSVDSHFLLTPKVTVALPSEPEIDQTSSSEPGDYGPDPAFVRTGFGGPLAAEVAFYDDFEPPMSPRLSLAQLVFKEDAEIGYDFQIPTRTIGVGATFSGTFVAAPGTFVPTDPPVFGLSPPNVGDATLNWYPPETVNHQFQVTDDKPIAELTWDDLVFDGPGKLSPQAEDPVFDAETRQFTWQSDGWGLGTYTARITATDSDGLQDTGVLTLVVKDVVDEPDRIIETHGAWVLSISDPVSVGDGSEDLVSVNLYVTNRLATEHLMFPNSFSGQIGANGSLHQEQFLTGAPISSQVTTPTATAAASSTVDSHFLLDPRVDVIAPDEPEVDDESSNEPGDYGPSSDVITGFGGPLEAAIGFYDANHPPAGATLPIAQLVGKRGTEFDYDFEVGTATLGLATSFQGVGNFGVPEPSSAALIGLTLATLIGYFRQVPRKV